MRSRGAPSPISASARAKVGRGGTSLRAEAPRRRKASQAFEGKRTSEGQVKAAGVIRDPAIASGIGQFAAIQFAASSSAVELSSIDPREASELKRGLDAFGREPNGGLIVTASVSATSHHELINSLALSHALPAIHAFRYSILSGGLASYGPKTIDVFRRAATYVDRILRGAKPSELPVQAPKKYELVINLRVARTLGLEMPQALLATADEVIE